MLLQGREAVLHPPRHLERPGPPEGAERAVAAGGRSALRLGASAPPPPSLGFTSSSEALFKDGDMCRLARKPEESPKPAKARPNGCRGYGGPARTLKVVFECGAEEAARPPPPPQLNGAPAPCEVSQEVVEVSEPSRCTYQARRARRR